MEWTPDQTAAFDLLQSTSNVFLTGGAGTGKSTVIQSYIKGPENVAVLASTGTAAILLGGRTFHSFFGLGIMEGGIDSVVERATKHRGIAQRIKRTDTILIDEVSMIGAPEWIAAERIARKVRASARSGGATSGAGSTPWGGLRVVTIGDFTQLPPVTKSFSDQNSFTEAPAEKPWCFLSETWGNTDFKSTCLKTIVRSKDLKWNEILNDLRWGNVSLRAVEALKSRMQPVTLDFQGTRLFARRMQVERLNHERLAMLKGEAREFNTVYIGNAQKIDELKRNAPLPEVLTLKLGALVMFRQNDPEYRYVNGTLGIVKEMPKEMSADQKLRVELLSGSSVNLKPFTFSVLDAEGESVATATNFPLNLAWATTIHKAQGATLDRAHVDIRGVWEHGQSYVALSRVRSLEDLTLETFAPAALQGLFKVDEAVKKFYQGL